MFTRAVGDLKESYPNYQIDIRSPANEIWENNPRLTPLREDDKEVEVFNIQYDEINVSGWSGIHFTDAFRHDLEKKLKVPIKKTGIKPELWVSEQEKYWINQVEVEFGWKGDFLLINAGHKQDNELKHYPFYQEVVDLANKYFQGRVKLVQIGHANHVHPELKGVLSLVGKTDLRQLIRLAYWSKMSVGPISLQFIISAAFEQPAVVVAGNKEGPRWQSYNWIRYITNVGSMECAKFDGCWKGGSIKGKCESLIKTNKGMVPKCFEMIKPYMVFDAIKSYYEGGRLSFEKK